MTNKYNNKYQKFWESKSLSEAQLYLFVASRVLTKWQKNLSTQGRIEREYRLDIYTGNHFIAKIFPDKKNSIYFWHINNFYCIESPLCAEGTASSLVMAEKACDKALKDMGYILLK